MNSSQRKPRGSYIVSSERYRYCIFGLMLFFLISSAILIIFGEGIHKHYGRAGVEPPGEYQSAFLSFIGTYLPIMILIISWMDFDTWIQLRKEKTHRWQGVVSVILVTILVIGSLIWLFNIIALSDFRVIKEGAVDPVVNPELLLSVRLYSYFSYQALGWSFLYLFGLFKSEPQSS